MMTPVDIVDIPVQNDSLWQLRDAARAEIKRRYPGSEGHRSVLPKASLCFC